MVDVLRPDAAGLARSAAILAGGGVVGFPTETVYGLAADALDAQAVRRIFALKGRPADNPLIVHLADAAAMHQVVSEVTPLAALLADRFWPGPLTLVLDARAEVPAVTTGGLATVAVRVPDHPVAAALLSAAGRPLAAPSANRSGRPSPTSAEHVVAEFGDALAVVLDGGPCPVGVESTVVDARGGSPVILREGSITREDLEEVVGEGVAGVEGVPDGAALASPGTRYRHYAPDCAIALVGAGQGPARSAALVGSGVRVGLVATAPAPPGVVAIARFDDASGLAQQLYTALRTAEQARVEVLVVEAVPEVGVGRAVMDRLRRASG